MLGKKKSRSRKLRKSDLLLPLSKEIVLRGGATQTRWVPVGVYNVLTIIGTPKNSCANYAGKDGPSDIASLWSPLSIDIDSADNIMIVEKDTDSRVRLMSPAGTITTLINRGANPLDGSLSSTASMYQYSGFFVNKANDVFYFTEMAHHMVRMVIADTGKTFSGKDAPGFSPGMGSLLANGGNNSVDGTQATAVFNRPCGIAFDPRGTRAYVAEEASFALRMLDITGPKTCFVSTLFQAKVGNSNVAISTMTVDNNGNLFFTLLGMHAIWKYVPPAAGVRTTGGLNGALVTFTHANGPKVFAGNATTPGYNDSATGTSALFNVPMGLCVDKNNNLYVADRNNNVIRYITPDGNVYTYAGVQSNQPELTGVLNDGNGAHTSARFSNPSSVIIDSFNNVIVLDQGVYASSNSTCRPYCRIRKISRIPLVTVTAVTTNSVTVSWPPPSEWSPGALPDQDDNTYSYIITPRDRDFEVAIDTITSPLTVTNLSDSTRYTIEIVITNPIRKLVTPPIPFVTRIEPANFSIRTPVSTTVSGKGTTVPHICNTVLEWNGAKGADVLAYSISPADFFGKTSITLIPKQKSPYCISDLVPSTTYTVALIASITNVPGINGGPSTTYSLTSPTSTFTTPGPRSMEIGTICGIFKEGGETTNASKVPIPASTAKIRNPRGTVLDKRGNLYVTSNSCVLKITPPTTNVYVYMRGEVPSVFFPTPHTTSNSSVTIYAGQAHNVGGTGSQDNPSDGATGDAIRFYNMSGMAYDPVEDAIYIADSQLHVVVKLTSDSAGLVTSRLVGRIGAEGSKDGDITTTAEFNTPKGIAIGPDGSLFIADCYNHAVRRIYKGQVTTIAKGILSGTDRNDLLKFPYGVAVLYDGNVYVTSTWRHCIKKLTPNPDGVTYTTTLYAGSDSDSGSDADGKLLDARFNKPQGLFVDVNNNIYVYDAGNYKIKLLSGGRSMTVFGGSGYKDGDKSVALLKGASLTDVVQQHDFAGLTSDNNGNIYFTDWGNGLLRCAFPAPPPIIDKATYDDFWAERTASAAHGQRTSSAISVQASASRKQRESSAITYKAMASSAVAQQASASVKERASSALAQKESTAKASSALAQAVSSPIAQVASSAVAYTASRAQASSAVAQVASSAVAQVASSALAQRISGARESSAVAQVASSAVAQTASKAQASSAVAQIASSAVAQTVSSALAQSISGSRESSAVAQKASSALAQEESSAQASSAVAQRASSAVAQVASSAVAQDASSAVAQVASSAVAQTASTAQASSALAQKESSAQASSAVAQRASSAVAQTASSAVAQKASNAQASSAVAQIASSAVVQKASSAVAQKASNAQASSALRQRESSAVAEGASSAVAQRASSAQQIEALGAPLSVKDSLVEYITMLQSDLLTQLAILYSHTESDSDKQLAKDFIEANLGDLHLQWDALSQISATIFAIAPLYQDRALQTRVPDPYLESKQLSRMYDSMRKGPIIIDSNGYIVPNTTTPNDRTLGASQEGGGIIAVSGASGASGASASTSPSAINRSVTILSTDVLLSGDLTLPNPSIWTPYFDTVARKYFYLNTTTGEGQYEHPFIPMFSKKDLPIFDVTTNFLPAGWIKLKNLEKSLPYYFNVNSTEASWTHPAPPPNPNSSTLSADPTIFPAYKKYISRDTLTLGKPFYVNSATKEAQWNFPDAAFNVGPSTAQQASSALAQNISGAQASSATAQVASSAVAQTVSSALAQRISGAQASSATAQVASSAVAQTASSALAQRISGAQASSATAQVASSAVAQTVSSALAQKDSSAKQQAASSAMYQQIEAATVSYRYILITPLASRAVTGPVALCGFFLDKTRVPVEWNSSAQASAVNADSLAPIIGTLTESVAPPTTATSAPIAESVALGTSGTSSPMSGTSAPLIESVAVPITTSSSPVSGTSAPLIESVAVPITTSSSPVSGTSAPMVESVAVGTSAPVSASSAPVVESVALPITRSSSPVSGSSATMTGGGTGPITYGPVDRGYGNIFNKGFTTKVGPITPGTAILIDNTVPITFNAYYFGLEANPDMDMMRWTIKGSKDGSVFVMIDDKSLEPQTTLVPNTRNSFIAPVELNVAANLKASSAFKYMASSAVAQTASSAVAQTVSSALAQKASSALAQSISGAQASSATAQIASSAVAQTVSSALAQSISGAQVSSAVAQKDSSAQQHKDSSAQQQTASSAVAQKDSSAQQQAASSSFQQRDSSAQQQAASSAEYIMTTSSAVAQNASSALQQNASSALEQTASSAYQQTASSALAENSLKGFIQLKDTIKEELKTLKGDISDYIGAVYSKTGDVTMSTVSSLRDLVGKLVSREADLKAAGDNIMKFKGQYQDSTLQTPIPDSTITTPGVTKVFDRLRNKYIWLDQNKTIIPNPSTPMMRSYGPTMQGGARSRRASRTPRAVRTTED